MNMTDNEVQDAALAVVMARLKFRRSDPEYNYIVKAVMHRILRDIEKEQATAMTSTKLDIRAQKIREDAERTVMGHLELTRNQVNDYIADAVIQQVLQDEAAGKEGE